MPVTFTWGQAVVAPPALAISNIVEDQLTDVSVRISWDVTEFAQGWITFGTTGGGPYPSETTRELSFLYDSHVQTISALTASTAYYYKIVAVNVAGDTALSAEGTFTTTGPIVPPPDPGITYTDYVIPASFGGYTIDATGVADSYLGIQAFVDSIPSGSSATVRSRIRAASSTAVYMMTEGIQLGNKSYLDLDGRYYATINAHPTTYNVGGGMVGTGGTLITSNVLLGLRRSGQYVNQQPYTDVKVYGWRLNGNGAASTPPFQGEAQANIVVGPGTGYELYDCITDKSRGDAIDVAGYGAFEGHIHDITNIRAERQFLTIDYAEDLLVHDCTAGITAYYFLDIEVSGSGRNVKRVTIRDCTWERFDAKTQVPGIGGMIAAFNQTWSGNVYEDILIERITATGSHHATLQTIIGDGTPMRITNFTVRNCTSAMTLPTTGSTNQLPYVMRARNVDGLTFTGNTQPGASGRWFGGIVSCTDTDFSGNTPPAP